MKIAPESTGPDRILMPVGKAQELLRAATLRQRQVAEQVAAGLSDKQITEKLDISISTLRSHLDNLHDLFDSQHRRRSRVAQVYSVAMQGSTFEKDLADPGTW